MESSPLGDTIEIQPVSMPIDGVVRPPGSKSITNRALIIASVADGDSVLRGVLESDDTRYMIESLTKLGLTIEALDSGEGVPALTVKGCSAKFPSESAELFIGNSGTSVRFLTAMLGIHGGEYRLDGVPRMRERPIGPLVDSLKQLGVAVDAVSPNQCPPVLINSDRVGQGTATVGGNISSQYLSGLLMAGPVTGQDFALRVNGELISKPYVEMTLEVMRSFGVEAVVSQGLDRFRIAGGQTYRGCDYQVEPDASAASYFWAAAAICGGTARVLGLNEHALQGDVRFVDVLERMGCHVDRHPDFISVTGPAKVGVDVDMGHISDTVQTLSAVALFVKGPTRVRNIAHNRVKETDRIGNLAIELRKFGVHVDEYEDGMTIHPSGLSGAEIETYDDHRMAMSLALVGLKQPGVVIREPGCVSKTYPAFFDDLAKFLKS